MRTLTRKLLSLLLGQWQRMEKDGASGQGGQPKRLLARMTRPVHKQPNQRLVLKKV